MSTTRRDTNSSFGDREVRYAYAGGFAPLQVAYDNGSGEDVYDVHTDHLDTPRMLTDATGTVAWRASYEAYGEAALDGGNSVTFNVRFPGQYFDAESGMHYNRHRYYAPELGRYVSADPIGQIDHTNLYQYAYSSPANFVDPNGEFGIAIPAIIGAGLTLGTAAAAWWAYNNQPTAEPTWPWSNGTDEKSDDTTGDVASDDATSSSEADQQCNDRDCDAQYENDLASCRAIGRTGNKRRASLCYASALERKIACELGKPLPPLITWNN